MKKFFLIALMTVMCAITSNAQNEKVYDETIDPIEQIDKAVLKAKSTNKLVICQLGGNWCPWCLKFAKYIKQDQEIDKLITENFEYIHVNYKSDKDERSQKANKRLNNAGRFGYPVLVILNPDGSVMHIQNSAYLEAGDSYDRKKVLQFFKQWTPAAAGIEI